MNRLFQRSRPHRKDRRNGTASVWRVIGIVMVYFVAGSLVESLRADEPLGLPEVSHPENNPATPEKIALGKQLFFDVRLSSDGRVSCATCHDPRKGFSGAEPFSEGVDEQPVSRHTPSLINVALQKSQMWDGRAKTLEEQALWPLQAPGEMNMPLKQAVSILKGIEGYQAQFRRVFNSDVTGDGLIKAIAAYERTLLSADAPYDRYQIGDDNHGMSEAAMRGMNLYFFKANCKECHRPPNFTNNQFHNIGLESKDAGRVIVTGKLEDTGAFKTPTLRDIKLSAPYMHDGSMATLEEVVEHYNKGGNPHPQLDIDMIPLKLTRDEQADLIAFLKEGLTGRITPDTSVPRLPK
jgi:cytochrome c peroxidase